MVKKQLMFGKDGGVVDNIKGNVSKYVKARSLKDTELRKRGNVRVVCPWCLNITTLDKFTTWNTQTYEIYKTLECNECHTRMKHPTAFIVDKRGPEGYSEWFWSQIFSFKAYSKVQDWDELKLRIHDMGFTSIFWEAWKRLTAEKARAKN